MFESLLFPTNFEELALPILQSISCLKRAGLREVVLLHVIDTGSLYTEVDGGLPIMVDTVRKALSSSVDLIRETAAKQLSTYVETLRAEGIEAKTEIVTGPIVSEILRVAEDHRVSLIVAGRQKRDVLGEIFVGSTTDRVIRKSKVPVLVAKYHTLTLAGSEVREHYCTDMLRKILFPTDWSACSGRAKDLLPLLRAAGASEVVLAHVIEDFSDFADIPGHLRDDARISMTSRAQEELEPMTRELQTHGFQVKAVLLYGDPYREIIRTATEEDVSLIVMGSHGKGFVRGILWGNVSQRVVEYSEKPVLVVK